MTDPAIRQSPLPGGLPPLPNPAGLGREGADTAGQGLRRDWRFRPLTGAIELSVAEAAATLDDPAAGGDIDHGPARVADSEPAQVTAVLSATLAELCGAPASAERVRALCVADRQFLMTRLAAVFDDGPVWLTARCRACGEPFDCAYRDAELPIKPAGDGFPTTAVETGFGMLSVRVPTGADQEAAAAAADEAGARRCLLQRLLGLSQDLDPDRLDPADLTAIEQAVEVLSPELGTTLTTACPGCGTENHIAIDPYRVLGRGTEPLLAEVHRLARHYHWGEAEILALPRHRRRAYLRLIDRERGMAEAPDAIAVGLGA